MNTKFERFIMLLIALNMVVMCLDSHNQPPEKDMILNYINIGFVAVFALESIMKLIALHIRFFTDPWNVFDFVVVILSILGKYYKHTCKHFKIF